MENVRLQPRGRGAFVAAVAVVVVMTSILFLRKADDKFKISDLPENQYLYLVVCFFDAILVTVVSEFLRRCFVLHEECFHLQHRYDGNKIKLLTSSLGTGNIRLPVLILVAGIGIFSLAFFQTNPLVIICVLGTQWNIIFIATTSCIAYIFGMRDPTAAEMSDYLERNKLNAGHGMAWSYYFGYLKLILPNFEERLQNWIEQNAPNSRYAPKLYILVPKSCYCYPSLKDADSRIEAAGSPEPISASRGGSVARIYKNTVYKISGDTEKETYYCVAEYATPILSLYEMANSDEAGLSLDEKLNQRKQFFTTLTEILSNRPDFAKTCILVAYDDKLEDDETKIGDVLKSQIDYDQLEMERSRAM